MNQKKVVFLALLSVMIFAQECGPGGVYCPSDQCHYPPYIEGCLKYASSNACHQC